MAYSIGEGTTIRKMLGGTVKYNIPRYQRKYIWNNKHWQDLWDDIIFIANSENSNIQHFFSTFIFEKNGNVNDIDNFTVIDGQQRLSTVMVILAAVCRIFIELDNQTQHSVIVQYLTAIDLNGKYIKIFNDNVDLLGNIITSVIDYKDKALLENIDVTKYHSYSKDKKNIYYCYMYYLDKLRSAICGLDKGEQCKTLNRITNTILDMQIVQIIVDQEQEGYDIFEILNARGTPLEQHELLKNYIFKFYKPVGDIDVAKEMWNEIDLLLTIKDHSSLATFIDHYTIHKYAKPDKINTVLRIIKQNNKTNETKEILLDIYKKAKYYRWLIAPNEILTNDIIESKKITEHIYSVLLYFCLKNQSQFRPLLISLFSTIDKAKRNCLRLSELGLTQKNSLKEARNTYNQTTVKVDNAISYLLNFSLVEFAIKKQQPKIFEKKIHELAQNIERGIIDIDQIEELMPITITRDMFISSFCLLGYSNKNAQYDRNNTKHDIRQILRMYEIYLQGTDELTIDNMTIEHVFNDSTTIIESCYIGNLLPLAESIQKDIGEETALDKKLPFYKTSQFAIVKDFVKKYSSHKMWTIDKIKQRSKNIAEIFYNHIFKLK